MELKLTKKGTVTECREALNAMLATLEPPETQEHKVKRMVAHYIVAELLDPLHDTWQAQVQAIRGAAGNLPLPPEPTAAFAIDCTIKLG
jgi:hypothetical protein